MLHALRHRGPDDQAIELLDNACLGHCRLSIIDLEGGRQPIPNEDRSKWIVCNGEIYNYQPLRRKLIEQGHKFRTRSDSEVILHLFEQHGTDCLKYLRGMFAFAIYDNQNQALFAARDHLGQKPFYYHLHNGQLGIASEIKGLLPLLENGAACNPQALLQYFSLRIIAQPHSMFAGIEKLAPGHWLRFDVKNGLRTGPYWDLCFEPKYTRGEADLTDELEQGLIDAVGLHLVADVEVGAFLSGGLDSTLITAIAAKQMGAGRLPTFTFGIPYGEYDEAPAAREVAKAYDTEHHEKTIVPSIQRLLPELLACLDEPSDPLSVCSYAISQMASQRVKVILGGDGGDELFGGYDRYYGHLYAGLYGRLPEALRQRLIGPLLDLLSDGGWYKSFAHQLKWLHQGSFMDGGERHASNLGYFYIGAGQRTQLFGPELLRAANEFDPYAKIVDAYHSAPAEHPIDRMLYADSKIRLGDHSVMILDRTSMAHGLEARSPFMDHKLAQFCARLPTALKVKSRSLRVIQKELAKRYLPQTVLARKKQGFASPLPYLLRGEYDTLAACFLQHSELAKTGYLRQQGIDEIRQAHHARTADHSQRLWLLINAEAWYRMYIQGQGQDQMHAQIAESAGRGSAAG